MAVMRLTLTTRQRNLSCVQEFIRNTSPPFQATDLIPLPRVACPRSPLSTPPLPSAVETLSSSMDSLQLKDLFTVAQFIKTRCSHGLKAGDPQNVKNYVFFEVEILDPRTRTQLCYLDKVRA